MGRTTREPETLATKTGKNVCTFTLAVNESEDVVSFFNCVAFDKVCDFAKEYIGKGHKLSIVGRLKQTSFKRKDGSMGSDVKIIVENIELIESKTKEKDDETIQVVSAFEE